MPGTIGDLPIERFERLERAILGDPEVGHLGAIQRLNVIDEDHRKIPENHDAMEKRRVDGDRRLHDRLTSHEEEATHNMNRIERKIDRLWWMLLGSTGAGVAIGWGISGAPLP